MRALSRFALASLCVLEASVAHAQAAVLVAASDPSQIAEVEVAKVTAVDSSLWLSVKLAAHAKLAVVTSADSVEPAKAADAWLRALDFSTRVRVSPPPGPLAACTRATGDLADSGFPELPSLSPSQVASVTSELELRRNLAAAGLDVDLARVAAFSASVPAPYRVALYEAVDTGGSTLALRLRDSGPALTVPGIAVAGRDGVPCTLLTLARTAVLPVVSTVSDPSEFAVSYSGANASTDYTKARGAWLAEDPTGWLLEARASSAVFAWTSAPGAGVIEPALLHYFQSVEPHDARSCFAAAQGARARAARDPAPYGCGIADDLELSLSELDFADIRVTRSYGSVGAAGIALRSSDEAEQNSCIVATDFDAQDCPSAVTVSSGSGGSTVPGGTTSAPGANMSGGTADYSARESTTVSDGDSCDVTVFSDSCSGDSSSNGSSSSDSCNGDSSGDSSSSDSCSGNSSSDSGSSDSCSGDSSGDSSSSDSCSGNSSSDSSSSDSCSGDSSSSSSDDSSGCGKSNYDGDTCSGSSANSASADAKTTAALEPGQSAQGVHRPRRVHLSLFTLLSALVALPLRRKKLWRLLSNP
jgi:hypothetical protein